MDIRRLLAGGMGLVSAGLVRAAAAASRRVPNFIVIYCDDLGYGDIGPMGGTAIPTPNLDRMAREGMTLTDYYAPANVCTPSRAGLLTGRYP
ncbi:MAG: sulfatase-like hydrolase/transferase, partial [Sphingopyxis sp.]|nr:sulfatase-like hydrolase/transferase [Sphingopyxis sp.]